MGERKDHHRDKWVNKGTAHSLKIAKASRGGWEREEKSRDQKGTGQHKGTAPGAHRPTREPIPWQSHKGSARVAPPNRTRKKPIRGQKVQLGPFFERGNTRRLLYLQRNTAPICGDNASNGFRI